MATIITVHGTFSSGPERGDQWWQVGGEFERDARQFLASTEETLKFRPFVWDGSNSVTARRLAGRRLHEELQKLEARNEPYVLVGHSRGGTVIAHCLAQASKNRLRQLSLWLTVGSPFTQTNPSLQSFIKLPVAPNGEIDNDANYR